MHKNTVFYEGVRCHANTKAAFVRWYMNTSRENRRLLLGELMRRGDRARFLEIEEQGQGGVRLRSEWDERRQEEVFDALFGERLCGERQKLSEEAEFLTAPALELNGRDLKIDSAPFFVYAIVRNPKCREALKERTRGREAEYYERFQASPYGGAPFLRWFLMEEKGAAKLAAGMIVKLRQEEGDSEGYQSFLEIVSAGYQPVKDAVKKLRRMSGENFGDLMGEREDMELTLSRIVLQLLFAGEYEIPVARDYAYYMALMMLLRYSRQWSGEEKPAEAPPDGRAAFRRIQRQFACPESYYLSTYMDEDNCGDLGTAMESVFRAYGLEQRMLAGIRLERGEAELICSAMGDMDRRTYKLTLLAATLCKYIASLHKLCARGEAAAKSGEEETNDSIV